MKNLLRFFAYFFLLNLLFAIPFVPYYMSVADKKELSWPIWIASFIPQLLSLLVIIKKFNLKKCLKKGLLQSPILFSYKYLLLGVLLPFFVWIFLLVPGFIKPTLNALNLSIGLTLLLQIIPIYLSALMEEVVFRMIPIQMLGSNIKFYEIIILSIIFGAFHIANPDITIIGCINIILAGVLFYLLYIISLSVYASTLVHFLWNYMIGCIFGSNISGLSVPRLLINKTQGSEVLSGGSFGFEGSLFTTILFVVAISFVMIKNRSKVFSKKVF